MSQLYGVCASCDEEFEFSYCIHPRTGNRVYSLRQRICEPCRFGFRPDTPVRQEPSRPGLRAELFKTAGPDEYRQALRDWEAAGVELQRARRAVLRLEDLLCLE